jgi:hypothetical protein
VTAAEIVSAELRKHAWLRSLPEDERRQIEDLALRLAERVETLTAGAWIARASGQRTSFQASRWARSSRQS